MALQDIKEIAVFYKNAWLNSLPVDRRQRQFTYLLGAIDIGLIVCMGIGKDALIPGMVLFALFVIVSFTGHTMKKKWQAEREREGSPDPTDSAST